MLPYRLVGFLYVSVVFVVSKVMPPDVYLYPIVVP